MKGIHISSAPPLPNIHLKPLLIIHHVRILPPRLRYRHIRDPGAKNATCEKDPQHVRETDSRGRAEMVEEQQGEDGAYFS